MSECLLSRQMTNPKPCGLSDRPWQLGLMWLGQLTAVISAIKPRLVRGQLSDFAAPAGPGHLMAQMSSGGACPYLSLDCTEQVPTQLGPLRLSEGKAPTSQPQRLLL